MAGALLVSAVAGWNIARGSVLLWAPLLLAIIALYFAVRPDVLLIGWLLAAPFLQESARLTTVGSALTNVLYVLPLLVLVLHLLRSNVVGRHARWYDALPLGYVVLILASEATVDAATLRAPSFYTTLLHAGILVGVPLYYFCAFGPLSRLSARTFAWAVLVSCSAMGALGIVQHYLDWAPWGQGTIDDPPRIVVTLANPAVLGAFLGVGILFATAILVWEGPTRLRSLAIATLALTVPSLYFTYTRGGVLATVVIVGLVVGLRPRTRAVVAGAALVLALGAFVGWGDISKSSVYQQRATDTENISGRLLQSRAALDLTLEKPAFGWGYGQYDRAKNNLQLSSGNLSETSLFYYTSHDTFLTILVELGILGLALFLLPWLVVALRTFRERETLAYPTWFTLSLLGTVGIYLITAVTTDMRFSSFVPALAWLSVGLLRRGLWDEASHE